MTPQSNAFHTRCDTIATGPKRARLAALGSGARSMNCEGDTPGTDFAISYVTQI